MATRKFSLRLRGVVFVCELRDASRLVGEICLSLSSAMLAVALRCVLPERLDFVSDFALSFLLTLSIGCIIIFPCLHVESFHCKKTTRNRGRSGNHRGDRSASWIYEGRNSDVHAGRAVNAYEIESDAVYMTLNGEERRESGEYAEIYGSIATYHSMIAMPSTSRRASIASVESRPPSLDSDVDGDFPSGPEESRP